MIKGKRYAIKIPPCRKDTAHIATWTCYEGGGGHFGGILVILVHSEVGYIF